MTLKDFHLKLLIGLPISFVADDLSKRLSGEFYTDDLDLIITLIEAALDVNIIKR